MLWWIGPATRPHDLGARLQAHGLAHAEELPGMALDLAALIEDVPAPPDLAIEEVADEGALMHWSRVVATCFEFGQELAGTVCALFAGIGFGEGSSFRHYIGVWRGEPVATSSLFLGTESAGIYCVATLLDARRQGIGAALTLAALREAGAQGYRTAILQAQGDAGARVYTRVGFAPFGQITEYKRTCPADSGGAGA